jgi:16S rRNA (uracil1498-N3)-methyltransferase
MRRFYLPPGQADNSGPYLSGQEARHLLKVLRLNIGDRVILFDNTNHEYQVQISAIVGEKVYFNIEKQEIRVRESGLQITLGMPLIRPQPFEWILQKGTELGVMAFRPFYSGRSRRDFQKMETSLRMERWQRIIIEAAKQCERNVFPELFSPVPFRELISRDQGEFKIIPYEQESSRSIAELEWSPTDPSPVWALVGPEGGFLREEIELAQGKGFKPVSLGPRILRSETAALALICLLQYRWGDMGQAKRGE